MRVYRKGDLLHNKVHGVILEIDALRLHSDDEYWVNIIYRTSNYYAGIGKLVIHRQYLDTYALVTDNKLIKELWS